ncbi:MAG: DUF5076 domain-containing protein [Phycisphaera sp.]|nr:DUF5076 domain-containing protein [Phycisphaera sp.]
MSATEDPILLQLSAAIETAIRGKLDRAVKLLDRMDPKTMEGEPREIFQKLTLRVDTMAAQIDASVKKRDEEIAKEQAEMNEIRDRLVELRKAHIRAQRRAAEEAAREAAATEELARKAAAPPKPATPAPPPPSEPAKVDEEPAKAETPSPPPGSPPPPPAPPKPAAPAPATPAATKPDAPRGHALSVPLGAGSSDSAVEVVRAWLVDKQVSLSTNGDALKDPAQVARLLTEITRAAARTQATADQVKTLHEIVGRFNVAIADVTRSHGGA